MNKIIIFILALIFLTASAPAIAQVSEKAAALSHKTAEKILTKSAGRKRTEGVISMIPIVISTEIKSKSMNNRIRITVSPTRINFGITF